MDKDRVEGKLKDIKGQVEEKVGEWTGNEDTQAKGITDQIKGKIQNAVGKAKDIVRDADKEAKQEETRNERDKDVA